GGRRGLRPRDRGGPGQRGGVEQQGLHVLHARDSRRGPRVLREGPRDQSGVQAGVVQQRLHVPRDQPPRGGRRRVPEGDRAGPGGRGPLEQPRQCALQPRPLRRIDPLLRARSRGEAGIRERVEQHGEYEEAWVFRGKILEEMGNALEAERCYDEALQCFRASLDLDPENAELHYHRALLLEDLERVDEAVEDYAAAASKSHSAEALVRLSALLLRLGRPADALVPADEAESRHPEDPHGWLAAGRAFAAMGRGAEAIESFEKAKALWAGEASLELARWHHSIGKDTEALDALQGDAQLSSEALLLRADIHAGLGRTDEALADH